MGVPTGRIVLPGLKSVVLAAADEVKGMTRGRIPVDCGELSPVGCIMSLKPPDFFLFV